MMYKIKPVQWIIFSLFALNSLSLSAAHSNHLPQKIYELDLTDQGISTQGGGLTLFKAKNYCTLQLNVYGEMGQEQYTFKFNPKGLINTRHVGYKYPVNVYKMKADSEVTVDFDKTYLADQNKILAQQFKHYQAKIPQKLIKQNCQ